MACSVRDALTSYHESDDAVAVKLATTLVRTVAKREKEETVRVEAEVTTFKKARFGE